MKRYLPRTSARYAALFLALLALVGIFADLIASEAPLLSHREGALAVLPGVVSQAGAQQTAGTPGFAVFAPIRATRRAAAGTTPLEPPSRAHPLGTDLEGRDVLAVTLHAARTTLVTALAIVALALSLGLLLGLGAGHGPALLDALLARAIELSGAVPALVLLVLLRAGQVLPGWLGFVAIVSVLKSLEVARLVRGEVLRVGGTDYLLAARALGASRTRMARTHVLPHVLGPLLVSSAFTAASAVALEGAVSFLGLGLPTDVPSWGSLLGQAGSGLPATGLIPPAVAIVATTLSLYLIADALDDLVCARRGGPSRV